MVNRVLKQTTFYAVPLDITRAGDSLSRLFDKFSHKLAMHKKWSFPLRISSVNVNKFSGNCGIWSDLLKKWLMENSIFCAVLSLSIIEWVAFFHGDRSSLL